MHDVINSNLPPTLLVSQVQHVTTTDSQTVATLLLLRSGARPFISLDKLQGKRGKKTKKKNQFHALWYETPEPFRFLVSGSLGTVAFYVLEDLIHNYLRSIPSPPPFVEKHTDSASFFAGYILQIAAQHLFNALFVYGLQTINTRRKYLRTLAGQYGAYFVAMIGSTVLNTWLRKQGMQKKHAFMSTMALFSIVNYFVIGWIVRRATENALEQKLREVQDEEESDDDDSLNPVVANPDIESLHASFKLKES